MAIDGKTLISWGVQPGPQFKAALATARALDDEGCMMAGDHEKPWEAKRQAKREARQ